MKDLSGEVISELSQRLKADEVARNYFYQSIGIQHNFDERTLANLVKYFPDTPVKLMKEVFEALQLNDLVDLLEKPVRKSHLARSLRTALPLHEIEKLRKTADRPTTYHSSAAVLIIDACVGSRTTEGIDSFFKDLNSKSEVTTIKCRNLLELNKLEIEMAYKFEQSKMDAIQKIESAVCKEIEEAKRAASTVVDRWIHNQGW